MILTSVFSGSPIVSQAASTTDLLAFEPSVAIKIFIAFSCCRKIFGFSESLSSRKFSASLIPRLKQAIYGSARREKGFQTAKKFSPPRKISRFFLL
jgi:hypothetical protein